MRYKQVYDGEWTQPTQKNHKAACCDCGLVHTVNFRVVNGKVQIQVTRDVKLTRSRRRNKDHKKQKL